MHSETDHDRVARYAVAFWLRHHKDQSPTVRRAAKSLGWTQTRVVDAIEGDPESRTYTTSYEGEDGPLGDHFIETWEVPDVE